MRIVLALIFTVLAHNSYAQEEWVGFRKVSELDQQTYHFKAFAENSIVHLVNLGASPTIASVPIKVIDVNKTPVTRMDRLQAPERAYDRVTNSELIQIETCRKQNIKMCPIMGTTSDSTGFFNNGKIMYTCRHSYRNWFVHVLDRNPHLTIDQLSPPILIYDRNGRNLYNSGTVSRANLLALTFVNSADELLRLSEGGFVMHGTVRQTLEQTSDIMEFTSNTDIVSPLPAARFVTAVPLEVYGVLKTYIAGYPGVTNMFGSNDSKGYELVASQGWLLFMSTLEWNLQTTNAVGPGSSGSPIFDEQGQIYGLACSGELSPNKDESATDGIIINKTGLRQSWETLRKLVSPL